MKNFSPIIAVICILLCTNCTKTSKLNLLKDQIKTIIEKSDGRVGVAIKNLDTNDTLSFNSNVKYPMQSVYKFPLAIAVLNQVDEKVLTLDQNFRISKNELLPDTWSPLRDKYPNGKIIPLSEIISFTVSQSDNNGCDILFNLLGGISYVDNYIHSLGITDISIKGTEEQMHSDWNIQFTNCCKPTAMIQLLEIFYRRSTLSDSSTHFLWHKMVETTTGANRLKGLLPVGTVVAHKTGTSGKNEDGVSAAVNDVGIIVLPNGQHVAIAVFVSNSKADDTVSEKVIAEIAKTVYDFYQ